MADDIVTPVVWSNTCDLSWSTDEPFSLSAEDLAGPGIVATVSSSTRR